MDRTRLDMINRRGAYRAAFDIMHLGTGCDHCEALPDHCDHKCLVHIMHWLNEPLSGNRMTNYQLCIRMDAYDIAQAIAEQFPFQSSDNVDVIAHLLNWEEQILQFLLTSVGGVCLLTSWRIQSGSSDAVAKKNIEEDLVGFLLRQKYGSEEQLHNSVRQWLQSYRG